MIDRSVLVLDCLSLQGMGLVPAGVPLAIALGLELPDDRNPSLQKTLSAVDKGVTWEKMKRYKLSLEKDNWYNYLFIYGALSKVGPRHSIVWRTAEGEMSVSFHDLHIVLSLAWWCVLIAGNAAGDER
jgi:hypothetical protein